MSRNLNLTKTIAAPPAWTTVPLSKTPSRLLAKLLAASGWAKSEKAIHVELTVEQKANRARTLKQASAARPALNAWRRIAPSAKFKK